MATALRQRPLSALVLTLSWRTNMEKRLAGAQATVMEILTSRRLDLCREHGYLPDMPGLQPDTHGIALCFV